MNNPKEGLSRCIHTLVAALLTAVACPTADAAIEVLGVQYQQDNPYPEYQCWYRYGDYPTTCHSTVVGANAHVFLKNTGASPVTISDVTLGRVQSQHDPQARRYLARHSQHLLQMG